MTLPLTNPQRPTLPLSTPQRRTTDSARTRRARCSAAGRSPAADLRKAAHRAQAVLADQAAAATPRTPRAAAATTTAAASARSARVADAVVAQWLLEQVPRRGVRAAHGVA